MLKSVDFALLKIVPPPYALIVGNWLASIPVN
jgi:hypothetical protein